MVTGKEITYSQSGGDALSEFNVNPRQRAPLRKPELEDIAINRYASVREKGFGSSKHVEPSHDY